jgi:hypothetical protein
MSLKLKLKKLLFRSLEVFPQKPGDWIYHRVQKIFSNEDLEFKIRSANNTFRTFEHLTLENGIRIQDRVIAEIGSGWLPLMPYFFKYMGKAAKVESFDLNKHYQKKNIAELNDQFSRKYGVRIKRKKDSKFGLPEAINYYPHTNILEQNLTDCDLVFSRFVLEHVTPEDLESMHLKFKNELNPGSHIIHLISPGDHRAYVDNRLSLQDFLQYSIKEWNMMQTRFDYHNRLRLPQYLEIFNKLELEIVHLSFNVPDEKSEYYRKFKKLKLHQDFLNFSEEELMAGAINIILKV